MFAEIRVIGRGVVPSGIRIGDSAEFTVHMNGTSGSELAVQVTDPETHNVPCQVQKQSNGDYQCCYQPTNEGPHLVDVQYGKQPVAESPFHVQVDGPTDLSIRAFGAGLKAAAVQQPAVFTLSGDHEAMEQVSVDVNGPADAQDLKISSQLQEDGTVDVSYQLPQPGLYTVHVQEQHNHVPGSPYFVQVAQLEPSQAAEADAVHAEGPGVSVDSVVKDKQTQFNLLTSDDSPLTDPLVQCFDRVSGEPVPVQCTPVQPALMQCQYTPVSSDGVVLYATVHGKNVSGSPFHVNVLQNDAQKVRLLSLFPFLLTTYQQSA